MSCSKQKKEMKKTAPAGPRVAASTSKKEKKGPSFNQTLADAEMDVMYAQYLQMAFIESEAKRTMLERSNYVRDINRKLLYLIAEYSKKVNAQTLSLQTYSFLVQVYEVIQEQEAILEALLPIVPSLETKYRKFAESVSVLKHKLHVRDIHVPQSGQEGDVIKMLTEMRVFIVEFFQQDSQYRKLVPTAYAYQAYVYYCEKIKNALKRGLDLVLEARSLAFSEASLALGT